MYRNEILFVEKFIASLRKINLESIPFKNDVFNSGIGKVHQYFRENNVIEQDESGDTELLFMQKPFVGDYDEISDVMLTLNGRLISLAIKNPLYEDAAIKISIEQADRLLKQENIGISENDFLNMALAFREGIQE